MKQVENIPEAASFMESSRAIGYNFSTAVADVMDNSVFAQSKNIELSFDAYVDSPFFIIKDDGNGMTRDELYQAMKYGAKNPSEERDINDLGRFGLGLKTASLSQCRKLTVISKKENQLSAMMWDLDVVIKEKKWIMLELDNNEISSLKYDTLLELQKSKSGTVVIWENLDRVGQKMPNFPKVYSKKIEELESHISLVFHRFIHGDARRIKITLNGRELDKIDPFLTNNFATQTKQLQVFKINNHPIKIQPYILPFIKKMTNSEIAMLGGKEKLKSTQGYYVYRNKRLIIWGKWFGQYPKHELQKLVRVQVDIPNSLDYIWDIDVKKSQAVLPHIIKKDLGIMINKALMDGKTIFNYRGRKVVSEENVEFFWNRIVNRGSITYKLNEDHPILKTINERIDDTNLFNAFISKCSELLPYMQIYNDLADSKEINKLDLVDDKKLDAIKSILKLLSKEKVKEILTGETRFEAFDLSKDDIEVLRGEFNL